MSAAPILSVSRDGEKVRDFPIEGEAMLGRGEGCVIRLDDRAISRQHAVFRSVNGNLQVEKKSDFAPISVNGTECTRAIIKAGDVISIGPYLMRLAEASKAVGSTPEEPSKDLPDFLTSEAHSEPTLAATISEEASHQDEQNDMLNPPSELPSLEPFDMSPGRATAVPEEIRSEAEILPIEQSTPSSSQEIPELEAVDEDANTKISGSAKVTAKLIFPAGVANVTELALSKNEISIGRGKNCDVVLEDKKASRKHVIIRRSGLNFTLKDLDSANGTFVNGIQTNEHPLSGDDQIRIGNTEFRFKVVDEAYQEQQPNFMSVPAELEIPEFQGFANMPPSQHDLGSLEQQNYNHPEAVEPPPVSGDLFEEISDVPGIGGVTSRKPDKGSLLEKFRALPKRRQAIMGFCMIALLYFGLFDDDEPPKPAPKQSVSGLKSAATFESLSPEQKKFVESQHSLGFDYYRNKDYDKALFEIQKIFALIPDYKDSREIERYSKEGKKKLEILEEERRKKEELDKLNARISELVDEGKEHMDRKEYDQAHDLFPQILALDPDNAKVAEWSKTVEAYEEEKRIQEQAKLVQQQINQRAWELYHEGLDFKTNAKYQDAIDSFKKVKDIGATDKKVNGLAAAEIQETTALIASLRDPVLQDAKSAEDSQDYPKAFALYEKATVIDPPHPTGYAGMARIRGILHDRAKGLYIEAVLAESYSDFSTSKKKFQDCLDVAPKDDVYHERATRKLASYFMKQEEKQ